MKQGTNRIYAKNAKSSKREAIAVVNHFAKQELLQEDRPMTIAEIAAYRKCSKVTICRYLREFRDSGGKHGLGPASGSGGGLRVRFSVVNKWIRSLEQSF